MSTYLFKDIHELLSAEGILTKKARGSISERDLSIKKKQAMVVKEGRIQWLGDQKKLPREFLKIKKSISVQKNIFPGFIDCHTHALFAGHRIHEFELRIQGKTYQEIAAGGGGIAHTVQATRKSSDPQLKKLLCERLDEFLRQGVTTVEVKTGYGLSAKEELRLLKLLNSTAHAVQIVPTFLGAHAVGPEASSAEEYLQSLKKTLEVIVQKKLTKRVDIFIEKNYFSLEQGRDYLSFAKKLGFDLTIHADQLSRTGATLLADELSAVSADHVICMEKKDIVQLAKSQTTCVLLPGADFYMDCAYPPARDLIDAGARVALSTDFNPGTSPSQNIQWIGLLARQKMKMTLPEVFSAFTVGASFALGLQNTKGPLVAGYDADFFVSDCDWDQFFYDLKPIPLSPYIQGSAKSSRKV